jgi:hypothetical protein
MAQMLLEGQPRRHEEDVISSGVEKSLSQSGPDLARGQAASLKPHAVGLGFPRSGVHGVLAGGVRRHNRQEDAKNAKARGS